MAQFTDLHGKIFLSLKEGFAIPVGTILCVTHNVLDEGTGLAKVSIDYLDRHGDSSEHYVGNNEPYKDYQDLCGLFGWDPLSFTPVN